MTPPTKLPLRTKLICGSASMMDWATTGLIVAVLWFPVFNIAFGLDPLLLGAVLAIYRIWDAFLDPVIGNLSDNTRSRWGRRRPYIVLGAVMCALVAPLIWWPSREWGEMGIALYITIVGLVLFTGYTVWTMPYQSLLIELSSDYDERTHVFAYVTFFQNLAIFLGAWVLALAALPYFNDPATGETDIIRGIRFLSVPIAIVFCVLGSLPGFLVKEERYAANIARQPKEAILQSIRNSIANGPLWLILGVAVFQLMGAIAFGQLSQYINIFYVYGGDLQGASIVEGWKGAVIFGVGAIAIPFWTWFCERFDKKIAVYIITLLSLCASVLNLYCLNPDYPYLQLIPYAFQAGITSSVWMILGSIKADVADYDEWKTGIRREGSLNAVFSWFFKVALTGSSLMAGLSLKLTGFDQAQGEAQSPEVLQNMLLAFIFLPAILWTGSFVCMAFYRLDRKKVAEIHAELATRRSG